MDTSSFAEIKEKFSKMNNLPYNRPRASTINNEPSSVAASPSVSEKLKTESSNQTLNNANPIISDPNTSLPQTSHETSSSHNAILARILHQGVNSIASFKKAPVSLPHSVIQHRNENKSPESLSVSQEPTLHRVLPPDVNIPPVSKKSPIPFPTSDEIENTYSELSDDLLNSASSSNIPQNENCYETFTRPSITLPSPVNLDRHENTHTESLSVSLDAMLPSKCMFFEFETMINDYQRRDPRTIIYPKIKATMPKITTNELNTLQRYSNT